MFHFVPHGDPAGASAEVGQKDYLRALSFNKFRMSAIKLETIKNKNLGKM